MWLLGRMALLGLSALPGKADAQGWLLLEARDIPSMCTQPVNCIGDSRLALRNLTNVTGRERQALLQILNRISVIRGIPEDLPQQSLIPPVDMTPALHPLPKAEKLATLIDHPGVFFDPAQLDANPETAGFSSLIMTALTQAGVRFLTEAEREVTPGRPTLSVRYSARSESAGCIIPFSVSMAISEEAVMVRNPALKISGSAWSKMAKENLANRNYTPTSALQEVLTAFVTDWKSQNP